MTNSDDVFGELLWAKKCLRKGDIDEALEAIVQAEKLWQAEVDYWALEVKEAREAAAFTERCGRIRGTPATTTGHTK